MEPHQHITTTVELATVRPTDQPALKTQLQELLRSWGHLFDPLPNGAVVLIKPSLQPGHDGRPRLNHDLLTGLIAVLRARGYDVLIGDSPSVLPDENRRIYQAAKLGELTALGAGIISFEETGAVAMPVGTRTYYIARAVLEADLVINMPVLDGVDRQMTHGALFNMLGVLPGFQKMSHFQQTPFAELLAGMLVDINSLIPSGFTLMAVDQPDESSLLICGDDNVAVDSIAAELAGYDADDIPVIRQAAAAGLGIGFREGIRLERQYREASVPVITRRRRSMAARLVRPFAQNIMAPFITAQPAVHKNRCDGCGDCVTGCPTGALSFESEATAPVLQSALCIGCFACRQTCHQDAISVKQSWLYNRLPEGWRRFCVE